MTCDERINDFIQTCQIIHKKGLVSGSGGNVSIRTAGGFLITASGLALEATTAEKLVYVTMDGRYDGALHPSKEVSLHLKCYAARPDIKAVVHVHSVYSVALSCLSELDEGSAVPAYTPGFGLRVGRLPVVPYYRPGSRELADAVSKVLTARDSVLMKNHGIVAVGDCAESALNLVEEIEENAKIHFILSGNGISLSTEQLRDLNNYR